MNGCKQMNWPLLKKLRDPNLLCYSKVWPLPVSQALVQEIIRKKLPEPSFSALVSANLLVLDEAPRTLQNGAKSLRFVRAYAIKLVIQEKCMKIEEVSKKLNTF